MKQEFPSQRPGEELLFVFRRHVITLTRAFLFLLLLVGIGFLPWLIVPNNPNLLFVGFGCLALGLLVFLQRWIGWYFSYYIATDQRIRYNRQKGLFNRSVVEINYDKVQSVAVNTSGVMASILKYGTIVIHTQVGDMIMNKISRAEEVYDKLQAAINDTAIEEQSDED